MHCITEAAAVAAATSTAAAAAAAAVAVEGKAVAVAVAVDARLLGRQIGRAAITQDGQGNGITHRRMSISLNANDRRGRQNQSDAARFRREACEGCQRRHRI